MASQSLVSSQSTNKTVHSSCTTVQTSSTNLQSSSTTVQSSSTNIQSSSTTVHSSSTNLQSSSTTSQPISHSTKSPFVLQQITLRPFDLDPDDSYHFLLAELSPAVLQDIPESDLGDVNHPASVRSSSANGLFTISDIQALVDPSSPVGPLYTSEEALNLAVHVSSFDLPNWRGGLHSH